MKKIENKKVTKKSLSHYCRAALLSLFVILTIPSISSGIFGNGDAEARCIAQRGNASGNASHTALNSLSVANKGIAAGLMCKYNGAQGTNASCSTTQFSNRSVCKTEGSYCTLTNEVLDGTTTLPCTIFEYDQCKSANLGGAGNACLWVEEDTENNKLVDAVCRVYLIATGTAGKAFAAVGVISVGIGFFTGKVSWGLMISVAAGIAVFFGAPSIITVISGTDAGNICSSVTS